MEDRFIEEINMLRKNHKKIVLNLGPSGVNNCLKSLTMQVL
jgi:hypothetical protein